MVFKKTYIKKNINKNTLFSLYDNNYGIEIIVNATILDVIVPEHFRNETNLVLNISRSSIKKISFDDNALKCTLNFFGKIFDYEIPYVHIRAVKAIKNDSDKEFWKKRKFREEFYKTFVKWLGIFSLFISVCCAIYAISKDLEVFNYALFDATSLLWNSQSTVFLYKALCFFVVMLECGWVLFISPIIVLANIFSISATWSEILVCLFIFITVIISYFHDENTTHQEPSLTEINLERIGLRPIFKRKKFNIKRDFVFYVGPFSEEYTNIYNNYIYSPIKGSGLRIQRADEIFGTMPVMDDIWNILNESSIVIAEVTGRNPNVMYEIGMAHTVGKKVIIITQNSEDIPFDLRHHRYIVYKNSKESLPALQSKLIATINHELGLTSL